MDGGKLEHGENRATRAAVSSVLRARWMASCAPFLFLFGCFRPTRPLVALLSHVLVGGRSHLTVSYDRPKLQTQRVPARFFLQVQIDFRH